MFLVGLRCGRAGSGTRGRGDTSNSRHGRIMRNLARLVLLCSLAVPLLQHVARLDARSPASDSEKITFEVASIKKVRLNFLSSTTPNGRRKTEW